MAGTWESENKVLPGAYINIRTNEPLSVTPGERGTVLLLQEIQEAEQTAVYTVTAEGSDLPQGATAGERKLALEALKKARKVLIYVLPSSHTQAQVAEALTRLKTYKWDVLCYPYDGEDETENKAAVAQFIKDMRDNEGIKCQAVLANCAGDSEGILNVVQGVIMADATELSAAQATAWVAGITAGAGITDSNTGALFPEAIDVKPRMTKLEMENAVKEGKFIFKVDTVQNVSVVYDINSLTTFTETKGKLLCKNRVIRTLDNIANDISSICETNYIGRVSNNQEGHTLLKAMLVEYFMSLQNMGAIREFETNDVTITAGAASDAVSVSVKVMPVDSVEKIYITVNLL